MVWLITFLEGVVSFISPCMLPLLPAYISFFAGGGRQKTALCAAAFVCGFTLAFCLMGVFAGFLGHLLSGHSRLVNAVCGVIIIIFGLSYLEVIPLPFFKGVQGERSAGGIAAAFVFGVIYSVSLTPCVGAFLGSALMLASASASALKGLVLLLLYSLGLGIPFVLTALFIDRMKGLTDAVKRHYKTINILSGVFLILVGAAIALGQLNRLMSLL
ncbi:MAG: sulfite exporter TauE/SafE family protein [Abditibacteriota bacterium]|nr:sulfite exporter TauE/SafE family protein [Abditibacteriota bacterium]